MKKLALLGTSLGALVALFACGGSPDESVDDQTGALNARGQAAPNSPLPADYETKTAQAKLDILWKEQQKAPYSTYPAWPEALETLKDSTESALGKFGIGPRTLPLTMTWGSDILPAERNGKKAVHTYGSVVKIEYRADATSPYTGLFKAGSTTVGLARLSLAHDTMGKKPFTGEPVRAGFGPGLALKLLIDGKPSQNTQAMWKIDGHDAKTGTLEDDDNDNFFLHPFSNIIPEPGSVPTKIIAQLFATVMPAHNNPGHLDVEELSRIDNQGNPVEDAIAPKRIFYVPAEPLSTCTRSTCTENPRGGRMVPANFDFRDDLKTIPAGTLLYTVMAVRDFAPGAEPSRTALPFTFLKEDGAPELSEAVKIGEIVTTSEMIAAPFGDQKLFFKHEGHGSGRSAAELQVMP